jgi:very-short-patch-repair endonuclease
MTQTPKRSTLETGFLTVWRAKFPGLGEPIPQYQFALADLGRKWALDFAWPDKKIGVEIDGGEFVSGGHNRGAQMKKDREKDREATKMGWRVLRYVGSDLRERPVQVVEEIAWLLSVV